MAEQNISVKMNIEGKSLIVAYLLWWFLGFLGVHRFYLGRTSSGLTQLLLFAIGFVTAIFIVGYFLIFAWFVWWALDAYFVYQIVAEENAKAGINNSTISFSKTGGLHNELDQLEKLHSLYEKGVISQEQYEAKKATLI